MITISFPLAELAFAGIWLLLRILVWIRRGRIDWKREALLLLMYGNLAVLLRITFFPMSDVGRPLVFDPGTVFPLWINPVPIVHLFDFYHRRTMLLNIIGNIAMFIPGGIILPVLYKKLDRFWKVTAAGALISLCIELLQLPFRTRATDIDDLILNTLGAMIGYGIYALTRRIASGRTKTE